MSTFIEKDEINVPIALSAFTDGDQGPSKVTKTERSLLLYILYIFIVHCHITSNHLQPAS